MPPGESIQLGLAKPGGTNGYGEHMASFNYYPHPQNSNPVAQATGSYDMQVMYSQTYDEYTLVGVSWTNQSPNYEFIHLRGPRSGNTFSGTSMAVYYNFTFNLTRISNEIMQIEMLDTDEDGIPDYVEQLINSGFLRMGNGVSLMDYEGAEQLSWNNINIQDSDGDGIPDGEEIYIRYPDDPEDGTYAWIQINSNPCLVDTDGDGYPDGSDERVMLWDVRIVEMDDDHVLFNSGNEWERIDCTAKQFYRSHPNPYAYANGSRSLNNLAQRFTVNEVVFLIPYNLEGLKLYFDFNNNIILREQAYKEFMGKDTGYMMGRGSGQMAWIFVMSMSTEYLLDQVSESTMSTGGGATGVLDNANYAQQNYGASFSPKGQVKYSELTGMSVNTVDDLAGAISNGAISPSQLEIHYIVRDGNTLILNTRTSQALT